MDITPLPRVGQSHIQSYSSGKFRVSNTLYTTPILVLPESVEEWHPTDALFDVSSFQGLVGQIDVLLVGTGTKMIFCLPKFRHDFSALGISIDAMDTGAACRTFNVLNSEGRRVAAALMPV